MISDEIQALVRRGDKDAFLGIYTQYAKQVYLRAAEDLGSDEEARDAVKQTFLLLRREMMLSDSPVDVEARIRALYGQEIAMRRLLKGDAPSPTPTPSPMEAAPLQSAAFPPAAVQDGAADELPVTVQIPALDGAPALPADPAPAFAPQPDERPAPQPAKKPLSPSPTPDALDRVQHYMQEDGVPQTPPHGRRGARRGHGPDGPHGRGRKRGENAVISGLIVLLSALLLWIVAGILMDFQVLPFVDLGYTWFNQNIFPLFHL